MTLFGVFSRILCGFDGIKVVGVRYNLNRFYYCEIAIVVSVTISYDLIALSPKMNRQPRDRRYLAGVKDKYGSDGAIQAYVAVRFQKRLLMGLMWSVQAIPTRIDS
jgi:hypothetical protein